LWLGLVISRLGDQFTVIALIWIVLQLTGSGIAIGLVVFCFQLLFSANGNYLQKVHFYAMVFPVIFLVAMSNWNTD
jgi:ABC-type siderophore export system fused ATPase/permease subunit